MAPLISHLCSVAKLELSFSRFISTVNLAGRHNTTSSLLLLTLASKPEENVVDVSCMLRANFSAFSTYRNNRKGSHLWTWSMNTCNTACLSCLISKQLGSTHPLIFAEIESFCYQVVWRLLLLLCFSVYFKLLVLFYAERFLFAVYELLELWLTSNHFPAALHIKSFTSENQ